MIVPTKWGVPFDSVYKKSPYPLYIDLITLN